MKRNITFNLYKENRRISHFENLNCIKNNETYIFMLDNIKTTFSKDLLIRENNEFKFTLDIKNKTSTYLLKEKNMLLDIKVEKINIKTTNSIIILEYKLESDEENTKIELIEKEDNNE